MNENNLPYKSKEVIFFLCKVLVIYILWFVIHDYFLVSHTTIVRDFIVFQAKISVYVLSLFPFQDHFTGSENAILMNGHRILSVGNECSGLILFAVFAGFIISFPGDLKSKVWFIPFGILVIFICNLLRIILLSINKAYYNSIFAFNHHVTFVYLIYAIIFGLWMFWMKRFRNYNDTQFYKPTNL